MFRGGPFSCRFSEMTGCNSVMKAQLQKPSTRQVFHRVALSRLWWSAKVEKTIPNDFPDRDSGRDSRWNWTPFAKEGLSMFIIDFFNGFTTWSTDISIVIIATYCDPCSCGTWTPRTCVKHVITMRRVEVIRCTWVGNQTNRKLKILDLFFKDYRIFFKHMAFFMIGWPIFFRGRFLWKMWHWPSPQDGPRTERDRMG